ncbi:MAG: hypothetical protein QNJ27_04560 [Simkaniaceae bacterium]|nr:hypothetical protein [Simkaniaceae bacterium]
MRYLFAFLFFGNVTLFAGSVRIMNDSSFPLNAEIIASDGSRKGKLSLAPQQQMTWQDSSSGAAVWSQTPYTVIFTCKNGKQFGVLSGVQQGGTVTALSSSGDRYCEPPKKKEEKQQNSKKWDQNSLSTPTTPLENESPDPSSSPSDSIWGPPS